MYRRIESITHLAWKVVQVQVVLGFAFIRKSIYVFMYVQQSAEKKWKS
jgi:hypothetical protein